MWEPLWIVIAGLVLLSGFVLLLERLEKEEWHLAAKGKLERIEWREKTYSKRSGAMVHHTSYYTIRYNTIYFQGGTIVYRATGGLDEFESGTSIRLLISTRGNWKIERAV